MPKKKCYSSFMYYDLVEMFCGSHTKLPKDLLLICLELAGLCGRGRSSAYFVVF
jgi:hypothetical protein